MGSDMKAGSRCIDGFEQLESAGFYQVGGKFTAMCIDMKGPKGKYLCVPTLNNEQQFLGVAWLRAGAWLWVTATGDGTSSAHTRGTPTDLHLVDGHLLPPIDKPQWSPEVPVTGLTSMLVTERERAAILMLRGESGTKHQHSQGPGIAEAIPFFTPLPTGPEQQL